MVLPHRYALLINNLSTQLIHITRRVKAEQLTIPLVAAGYAVGISNGMDVKRG